LEELVGRLRMTEDRMEMESVTEKTGKLMLTEEEWVSKNRHLLLPEPSSTGGGKKRNGFNPAKYKGVARDGDGRGDRKEPVIKFTSEGLRGARVVAGTVVMATGRWTAKGLKRESAGRKHIMCKRRMSQRCCWP
jgi:hypothetical protein